jgi:hypothetical protein
MQKLMKGRGMKKGKGGTGYSLASLISSFDACKGWSGKVVSFAEKNVGKKDKGRKYLDAMGVDRPWLGSESRSQRPTDRECRVQAQVGWR